jgi:hypothetical protein
MARTHRRILMSLGVLLILGACGPATSAQRIPAVPQASPIIQAATPSSVAAATPAPTLIAEMAPAHSAVPTSTLSPTKMTDVQPTAQPTGPPRITPVALPDGAAGIGFDDLHYDSTLGRLLVPAGRTGNLDLVDPQTLGVTSIGGFSAQRRFGGSHDEGTTSVDAGRGLLFAIDRTTMRLDVVDPSAGAIIAAAQLASSPDYIRYVAATSEVWVIEPDREQIEVFTLPDGKASAPAHTAAITVQGGPESLIIDSQRRRAYTHLWDGATVAVDLTSRSIVAQWPNGCNGSRGIALDERRGWLFAGCAEGMGVVLDIDHGGRQLSSIRVGAGVDVIDYNPTLSHLYLPGATSATMAIVGVSAIGTLSLLGTVATSMGAHCVAADTHSTAWVCDPDHGQLLRITDPFPVAGT